MKKIALLLIVAMLLSAIFAVIPASAAELEKSAIDFTKLDYKIRDWKSKKAYTLEEFNAWITTETKANSLATNATDANDPENNNGGDDDQFATAYFSKVFPITSATMATVYVKAKNNRPGGYCGLIFAADAEDHPYFVYGALNNYGDNDKEKSDLRARYRYHNNDASIGSQLSTTSVYLTQKLDADGYASFKIVYEGLTATIYTETADGWTQVVFGEMKNFTLTEGSYIALGIYSRHGHANKARTATLLDPTVEAANVKSLFRDRLGEYVAKAGALAPAAYTQESYAALAAAVGNAGALAEDADVAAMETCTFDISKAINGLVPAKYNVSFDANGGTGTMDPIADVDGGEYKIPASTFTAPEGMVFKGWATSKDGEVISGKATLVADTTFYAIWTPITYTVSFQRNGGSGKMFDAEDIVGEYTLPECTFTAPTGKVFKGWALEKDGEVVGETYNITGETTFYAIWGDPDYTVEFNSNGGSGEIASVETNGEYTLPECTFTAPAGKI
ncbi:MAG: InlB B-repeat-containing protein, partial [Clostridia bacterium]|nr:InlB B-repeat-containing protein [Clostridia bacterium]